MHSSNFLERKLSRIGGAIRACFSHSKRCWSNKSTITIIKLVRDVLLEMKQEQDFFQANQASIQKRTIKKKKELIDLSLYL